VLASLVALSRRELSAGGIADFEDGTVQGWVADYTLTPVAGGSQDTEWSLQLDRTDGGWNQSLNSDWRWLDWLSSVVADESTIDEERKPQTLRAFVSMARQLKYRRAGRHLPYLGSTCYVAVYSCKTVQSKTTSIPIQAHGASRSDVALGAGVSTDCGLSPDSPVCCCTI
jgi:hypothetical protein